MSVKNDVTQRRDVTIVHSDQVNLCGCRIGDHSSIGGRCKISSHTDAQAEETVVALCQAIKDAQT